MRAYKIWYDIKHFIHKDSTDEDVFWTENIEEAKDLPKVEAYKYFFDTLGFCINGSRANALQTME
jgi:hypothetical protein